MRCFDRLFIITSPFPLRKYCQIIIPFISTKYTSKLSLCIKFGRVGTPFFLMIDKIGVLSSLISTACHRRRLTYTKCHGNRHARRVHCRRDYTALITLPREIILHCYGRALASRNGETALEDNTLSAGGYQALRAIPWTQPYIPMRSIIYKQLKSTG